MATKKQPRRLRPKAGATKATALAPTLTMSRMIENARRGRSAAKIVISATKRAGDLETALRDVLGIVSRVGGFMHAEDQALVRNARAVLSEVA